MNIYVASQRILVLRDLVAASDAQKKASEKKMSAFGAISQVTGFFRRPADDDFEISYSEHRYQPFWNVITKARYVYDRNTTYQIAVSGREVTSVTTFKTDFPNTNGHIHIPVTEHCTQEEHEEIYVDGISGKSGQALSAYAGKPFETVKDSIEAVVAKSSIIVPPNIRVSAIMRDALSKMIKGIQADKIIEEHVEVSAVNLYYRPVHAFQFVWKSKGKEGIVEVDGVTGEISAGNKMFKEYLGKVLDTDFLFDIGADAAGMVVPGGSIAVKAAKKLLTKR